MDRGRKEKIVLRRKLPVRYSKTEGIIVYEKKKKIDHCKYLT